jgi:hypothetical protein
MVVRKQPSQTTNAGGKLMPNNMQEEIRPFQAGDPVVLAEGTYQGTPGVFVRFKADANWFEMEERNGVIRSHPVAWLQHR